MAISRRNQHRVDIDIPSFKEMTCFTSSNSAIDIKFNRIAIVPDAECNMPLDV